MPKNFKKKYFKYKSKIKIMLDQVGGELTSIECKLCNRAQLSSLK